MAAGTRDIPQLTGLRGLAALWVFLFHGTAMFGGPEWLVWSGAGGFLGVDVFFVLSGFVIALNYADAGAHRSVAAWGGFLWKRLARVYPVHLAALALFALFAYTYGPSFALWYYLPLDALPRIITLTQAWDAPIPKSWNVVSWSVSAELAAYIAFPAIAFAIWRIRSRAGCVVLVAAAFAALWWVLHSRIFGSSGTMAYGMPRIAAEFTAGVALCRLHVLEGEGRRWLLVSFLALVALFVASNTLDIGRKDLDVLEWVGPLAAVVVYGLARGGGMVERFLSTRPLQYAGHVSYAFYMVHAIAIRLIEIQKTKGAFAIAASFVLALGFAHMFYTYIETPARAWMLKIAASRQAQPSLATRHLGT